MQGLGLRIRGIIILPMVSGLIFGVLHLANPEMSVPSGAWMLGVSYFLVGFFAGVITLLDGGLELALGLHIANNLYTALVVNTTVSALASESYFKVNEIDPLYGLISLIIGMVIFYLLAFIIFPRINRASKPEIKMQEE
jgi:membrane protease YdiL (CAAX protease family)